MKRNILLSLMAFMLFLDAYAQNYDIIIKSYYSKPNEISIEIHNETNKEMVVDLNKWNSYANFYNEPKQLAFDRQRPYALRATDSLRMLAKIPAHKTYIATYTVRDSLCKYMHITMRCAFNCDNSPANIQWNSYGGKDKIQPYDSLREQKKSDVYVCSDDKITGERVYSKPEIMPEFPGGINSMLRYIGKESTQYTDMHTDMDRVVIEVVVEKGGSLTHLCVLSGKYPGFFQAATEIVQRMPKWKPGYHQGKPVRTFYTIPITFKMF